MATQTSTLNSLRHLYAMAEVARLKYKADIEVRLITVPEDYKLALAGPARRLREETAPEGVFR